LTQLHELTFNVKESQKIVANNASKHGTETANILLGYGFNLLARVDTTAALLISFLSDHIYLMFHCVLNVALCFPLLKMIYYICEFEQQIAAYFIFCCLFHV